jgi:hypothetical protein
LLALGIRPPATALNALYTTDNTSAWYWLACTELGQPIFSQLLALGIRPPATALNALCTTDNTSAWYWLAADDEGTSAFNQLIEIDILPNTMAMSAMHHTQNNSAMVHLREINMLFAVKVSARICATEHIGKHISQPEHNPVAILLSREDASLFYGFLYLFYRMSVKSNNVPKLVDMDVMMNIAKYVLPASSTLTRYMLLSDESRAVFVRYHVNNRLTHYIEKFKIKQHKERAQSLQIALNESSQPHDLLRKQHAMSIFAGKKPYKPAIYKHENVFSKKVTDSEFKDILCEGYRLSRWS